MLFEEIKTYVQHYKLICAKFSVVFLVNVFVVSLATIIAT